MANPINNDYSEAVISTINAVRLENKLVPIWLGSEAGPDGGTGGRPGGYIGKLSQKNVAYDTTEAATLSTSGSGSLLDNLNHIRYRVQDLETIASGIPQTFLDLADVDPNDYINSAGYSVVVNESETGLEFVLFSGGGATSFLGLTDVNPESYTGYAGYIVSVNDEEDGLEFITMSDGGASSFLELTDTPSTYAGEAGKAAVVNDAENALEFVEMLTETDVSANMLVNSNFILSLSSDDSPVYWEIDLGSGAQAYADYGYAASDFTYEGPLLTIWPSSSEVTRVSQKVHIRTGLNTPAPFQNWFSSVGNVKFGAMIRAYWFGGGAPPPNAVRLFATNGVSTNYSSYVMDDGEWHFVTVNAPSMFTHTNYEFGIEVAGVTDYYGIYVTNAIVTMRDLVDGQPYWVAHPQDFNNVLHLPDFDNDPATPPANTQILYSKGDNLYKMNSAGEVTLLGSGGGGGASSFLDLTDVDPASYTGYAGYSVVVNDEETGLDFQLIEGGSAAALSGLTAEANLAAATHSHNITDINNLVDPSFTVYNDSGVTVYTGDVGFLRTSSIGETGSAFSFETTQASFGDYLPCAVVVGGEDGSLIKVVRSGQVYLKYTGSAPSRGRMLKMTGSGGTVELIGYPAGWDAADEITPDIFAIADESGSGGLVKATLMLNRIQRPFISDNDLLRINSATSYGSGVGWTGIINDGTPTTSPITVSTATGTITNIAPASSSELGKIILRNTTRGDETYITGISGNNITVNPANGSWVNGDSLTTNASPTAGINELRGVRVTGLPLYTVSLGLSLLYNDSSISNSTLLIHPYDSYADSKAVYTEAQVAGVWMRAYPNVPLIHNRILVGNSAAGTATLIVRVQSVVVAAP